MNRLTLSKIVDQDLSDFMGSLEIGSLFTNIPLEETIKICTNDLSETRTLFMVWKELNLKIFYL